MGGRVIVTGSQFFVALAKSANNVGRDNLVIGLHSEMSRLRLLVRRRRDGTLAVLPATR